MATIKLNLDDSRNTSIEERIIFAVVREFGHRLKIHTKQRIKPNYWDKKKQKAISSYIGYSELNNYLDKFKSDINIEILKLRSIDSDIATEELFKKLKQIYSDKNDKNRKKPKQSFFDIFDLFTNFKNVQTITKTKYLTFINRLRAYQSETGEIITLDMIDLNFLDRYINHLTVVKQLHNNTISKEVEILKTFLNWCSDRNYEIKNDYRKFNLKKVKTQITALTVKEFLKLYKADLSDNPRLDKARDLYCFMCATSARISDLQNIKRADIKGSIWQFRDKKTDDLATIEINEIAEAILNKYKDNPIPLPLISSQKLNNYLKEVCKIVEINEPTTVYEYVGKQRSEKVVPKYELITNHTARRTFVTLSKQFGLRNEIVMRQTGHNDEKTMNKYNSIAQSQVSKEVNSVWNLSKLTALAAESQN